MRKTEEIYIYRLPQECNERPTIHHQQKCLRMVLLGIPTALKHHFYEKTGKQGDGFCLKDSKMYLSRHNFAIDTANVDACIKASLVVCINNITSKSLVSTNSAVVWPLWTRETTLRPPQRPVDVLLQQGVFLLNSVPINSQKI